jgi:AP2-associated kinase
MLKENMQSRPNIYQVLKEGCAMQGRDVPIQDVRGLLPLVELILTLSRSTLTKPNLMAEMTALSVGNNRQSKRQS